MSMFCIFSNTKHWHLSLTMCITGSKLQIAMRHVKHIRMTNVIKIESQRWKQNVFISFANMDLRISSRLSTVFFLQRPSVKHQFSILLHTMLSIRSLTITDGIPFFRESCFYEIKKIREMIHVQFFLYDDHSKVGRVWLLNRKDETKFIPKCSIWHFKSCVSRGIRDISTVIWDCVTISNM